MPTDSRVSKNSYRQIAKPLNVTPTTWAKSDDWKVLQKALHENKREQVRKA